MGDRCVGDEAHTLREVLGLGTLLTTKEGVYATHESSQVLVVFRRKLVVDLFHAFEIRGRTTAAERIAGGRERLKNLHVSLIVQNVENGTLWRTADHFRFYIEGLLHSRRTEMEE